MKKTILLSLFLWFILSQSSNAQALSGNYTVGAGGDYTTFAAATSALQSNGIGAGGAVFNIFPGVYTENISLSSISGLSASSRLEFRAVPGTVEIVGTGTTATSDAVININSLSYITLYGLEIRDGGSVGSEVEFGIRLINSANGACRFNIIRRCGITMGVAGSRPIVATRGILITSTAANATLTNNSNHIDSCMIDNSSWGIQIRGNANLFSGAIIQADSGNRVTNSSFGSRRALGHSLSSGALAINFQANRRFEFTNNVIDSVLNDNSAPILPVVTSGVSLDQGSGFIANNIIRNVIYEGTVGSTIGIRASIISGDTLTIANNLIYNLRRSNFTASTTDPSLSLQGIWIFSQASSNGYCRVWHNTVWMNSSGAFSYSSGGVQLIGGSSGQFPAEIRNNIILNTISTLSTSYRAFALVDGNTSRGFLRANHNILYANGQNGYLGVIGRELGGTEQFTNDINLWPGISSTDSNSRSFFPAFIDTASRDFDIDWTAVVDTASYQAPVLAEVNNDLLGRTRDSLLVVIGALEPALGTVAGVLLQEKLELSIDIFPNPINERFFTIKTSESIDQVRISDIQGRTKMTWSQLTTEGLTKQLEIPEGELVQGIYFLQIQQGDKVYHKKLIYQP